MATDRLSTAQVGKIRRLSQPRELAPDEEGGELNIVPFLNIIVNILCHIIIITEIILNSLHHIINNPIFNILNTFLQCNST
jgi:hypothetical protein